MSRYLQARRARSPTRRVAEHSLERPFDPFLQAFASGCVSIFGDCFADIQFLLPRQYQGSSHSLVSKSPRQQDATLIGGLQERESSSIRSAPELRIGRAVPAFLSGVDHPEICLATGPRSSQLVKAAAWRSEALRKWCVLPSLL